MSTPNTIDQVRTAIISLRALSNDLDVIIRVLDEKHALVLGNIEKLNRTLEDLEKKEVADDDTH